MQKKDGTNESENFAVRKKYVFLIFKTRNLVRRTVSNVEINTSQGTNTTGMVAGFIEQSLQIRTRDSERVKERDTIKSSFARI